MYSSIVRKTCKCGCGKMPTTSFRGYNMDCRPDIKEEIKKKHNARQYQKQKVGKLVREQMQDGNHDQASRQNIYNDLDWVVSRIVRIMAADKNGLLKCYCCQKTLQWSMADCAHFISRKCLQLRWDIKWNLRPNCKTCNQHEYGNLEAFATELEKEQSDIVEQLREMEKEVYKPDLQELKQMLLDFRAKLRLIETKFKTQ